MPCLQGGSILITLKVPSNKIELKISIGAMVNLTAKMKVMNRDVKL